IGYVAPAENDPSLTSPLWGILGSLICTLVVVLPSFILVAKTSHFITKHHESGIIKAIFSGLRPVVVGLIASAALMLMNADNFGSTSPQVITSVIICAVSFAIVFFTKIHPILVICLSGLAGWIIYSGVIF
ncbi:MAG: chromate transporter, partial [Muribaculaceae bacterium]|nr:chromate transporter [Muribaculaceae bacterium]